MLIASLYCSLFLSCWVHLRLHLSPSGGFLRKVIAEGAGATKSMLLCPKSAAEIACNHLKVKDEDFEPGFISWCQKSAPFPYCSLPFRTSFRKEMWIQKNENRVNGNWVFVEDNALGFMISDDLQIVGREEIEEIKDIERVF